MNRHKALVKQTKKAHFKTKKAPSDISVKTLFKDSIHSLDVTGNGPPTMYLWGNRSLYIEHYEKILEYTGICIKLQLKHMVLKIEGQGLMVEYFSKHELKVRGNIDRIDFTDQDRREPV